MTDQSMQQDKAKKDRSPSFPFISLERAIERARQFADNHKRSEARLVVVAPSWGYGAKSSGLLQTASALKQYGLIEDLGSGADRKIKLSELGWRILLDSRPGARDQAIRESATKPRLIAECLEKWTATRPSDGHCLSELQLDRGFNQEAAKVFLKVFDETISFAGLKENDTLSSSPMETGSNVPQLSKVVHPLTMGAPAPLEPKEEPYEARHTPGRLRGTFDIKDAAGADSLISLLNLWKAVNRVAGAAKRPEGKYSGGEVAPTTGMYLQTHSGGDQPDTLIDLVEGAIFPSCATCGNEVIYTLMRKAE
jgi:hypothetical protein